jgi:glutamate synthase (NADPH/NADH) small chain
MGKETGFLELDRRERDYLDPKERLKNYREFVIQPDDATLTGQASRCMNCGIPYCHNGCPVNNMIPDWNHLVYEADWKRALANLHSTNNFPEFTGRICPAPCEAACVLGINEPPVSIKLIERTIIDHAWEEGWIRPEPAERPTGKRVAVIGSGPAGLAAAQQLARAGHSVEVFEKADRIGGLLRYGIPDFKMEKHHIDRRLEQMAGEGVKFHTKAYVGAAIPIEDLQKEFDAVLLAIGAESPRDLNVPGRELTGIHFAMDFLPQQNKRVAGDSGIVADPTRLAQPILATGKRVVIIGGGDTGADCLGTSHRHKAASVHQFEIMPMPPPERASSTPWPLWPLMLRQESSHEEGGVRGWSMNTTHFTGDEQGNVKKLHGVKVGPPPKFEPIPGSEFSMDVDLVLLAMGFLGPRRDGLIGALQEKGLQLDQRGNIAAGENCMSTIPGIFAAGDARRGQSLVVWAISEGRKAARGIDQYLMGETNLP